MIKGDFLWGNNFPWLLEQAAGRETEARDIQLQEKDTELERQQRELQALRVILK